MMTFNSNYGNANKSCKTSNNKYNTEHCFLLSEQSSVFFRILQLFFRYFFNTFHTFLMAKSVIFE